MTAPETTPAEDFLPGLKHVYGIQALLVSTSSLGLFFLSKNQVPAFLFGALLTTLNFMFLVGVWRGVLDKKHIARTIGVVVIKYAILGAVLFIFVREFRFQLMPLTAGLSTLVGTFLVVALQTHFINRRR